MGRVVNAARFLEQAKAAGFWVYGAAMEGESLWSVDISGRFGPLPGLGGSRVSGA